MFPVFFFFRNSESKPEKTHCSCGAELPETCTACSKTIEYSSRTFEKTLVCFLVLFLALVFSMFYYSISEDNKKDEELKKQTESCLVKTCDDDHYPALDRDNQCVCRYGKLAK